MTKYLLTGGKRLAYTDNGEGDVIVLLHGYLESLLIWEDFARALSRYFRVISVDLPGHGLSEMVSDSHSMEMIAGKVRMLADSLEIEKMLLTGHSLGGYAVLAFLELFPERLAGYCLFHSHPFADTEAATERRSREIRVVKAGRKHLMYPGNIDRMYSPHNLDRLKDRIIRSNEIASHTSDEGIIAVLRGMIARPSRKDLLEKGLVPLLWILGIHDQYIDFRSVTSGVTLPGNAILATLYESGHLGFIEEPERSLSLLTEFAFRVYGTNSRA